MRKRHPVGAEIDLTPVLSTIVHIIPIVLIAVRFVTVNEHVVENPTITASESPSRELLDAQDAERVVVRILPTGFVVRGSGEGEATLPCRAPCGPADYDYGSLSDAMVAARQRHPTTKTVIVAPDGAIPYAIIIGVFDAATQRVSGEQVLPLFSDPVLVDGAGAPAAAGVVP